MYILYGGKYTRALITEMVLAEAGLDYELRTVDTAAKENLSPEFLKINPAGWVPALITPEGEALYETPAINLYLAERHGVTHLAPVIDDPDRGRFLSAFFYLSGELEPAMKRYFFAHRFADGDKDAPVVNAKAFQYARNCLKVIDGRLAESGPFQLGERFSMVDLIVSYWVENFEEAGVLDGLDHLCHCIDLTKARPRLKPQFEILDQWMADYYARRDAGGGIR